MPAVAQQTTRDVGERHTIIRRGGRTSAERCHFALARVQNGDGGEERSGAAAPPQVEPPSPDLPAARIGAALERLDNRHKGRAALRYVSLANRRTIETADGLKVEKPHAVWALVGRIRCANGRSVPVGWSGTGDGISRLENPVLNARLDWLVAGAVEAEVGEAGAVPVVLSPQAAAVLIHESVGHFAEASPRADLSHRLGCRVAAEEFMLFDDPAAAGGVADYDHDDEAFEAIGPTEIVRDGILTAQLHSRDSAARAGTLPTGNGRAAIWSAPLPRMSNLVCPPGACSVEALCEGVWQGLMIHHLAHGYGLGIHVEADVVLAEKIERGRPTGRFVTGLRVVDKVGLLARAVGIGERAETNPNGMCGKGGQILFDVGTIAPAIQLTHLELRQ